MIRINLAKRKMSNVVAGEGKPGAKNILANLDFESFKDLPIRKFGLPIVVAILATYFLGDFKSQEIQKVQDEITKAMAEQTKLQLELTKTKRFDELKKQIDSDEFMIKTKLQTIEKLIVDRTTPPKLLLALSRAIPADVWLSDLKVNGTEVTLKGSSLDFNQISDFMRNLNESAFFKELNLRSTQQAKDESGLEIAQFELSALRRIE